MRKCLHDEIALELLKGHSVAALIWLVEKGREVELSCRSHDCFISQSGSERSVSLWVDGQEQSFDSAEELVESAVIDGVSLNKIWPEAHVYGLC